MKTPRAVATVAALAALTACGSGSLPLLPSAGGAGAAEDSRANASGMSAPFSSVHYTLSKGFKDELPDTATAYELGHTTTAGAVAKLARALGVRGSAAESTGEWTVEAGGRTVRVAKTGGLPFSLDGDKGVSSGYACAEARSVPPDKPIEPPADEPARPPADAGAEPATVVPGDDARCAEPVPNPELPTEQAATKIARDALSAAGLDLEGAKITADGGSEAWNVTVQHRVGDVVTSGLASSVIVGPKGRIVAAYGMLGSPKALGDYPLVSAAKAVERLNGLHNGSGTEGKLRGPALTDDRPTAAAENTGVSAGQTAPDEPTLGVPAPQECDDPAVSCAPPPSPAEPPQPTQQQVQEAVLTEGVAALTTVRELTIARGSDPAVALLLVPAFSFTIADGGEVQVEAVTDEHLRKPSDSPEPEPLPGDGGKVDPDGGGSDSGNCAAQMGTPAPGAGQPLELEVCIEPAKAKVGQEVAFTIKAKDADGSFVDGPCETPVEPRYGDEGDDGGTARCMACAAATEGQHSYDTVLKHTYKKAGSYTATFDVHSGSSCDPRPGDSKGSIDIRVEVTN